MRWLLCCVVVSVIVARAGGEDWSNAASDALPGGGWHGWVVAPGTEGAALVHLAPRGVDGAGSGSARIARRLARVPEAIAAGRDELFLFLPLLRREGEDRRPVSKLTVAPSPIAGLWSYDPAGRLVDLPQLRRSEPILGAGAVGAHVVALLAAEPPVMVTPTEDGWVELADAWPAGESPRAGDAWRLVDGVGSVGLLVERADGSRRAWRGRIGVVGETLTLAWVEEVSVEIPVGSPVALGDVSWAVAAEGEWAIIAPGYRVPIGAFDDERSAGVVSVGSPERFAAVSLAAEPGRAGQLRLREVSGATGTELHRGAATNGSPVTAQDFRLLALLLAGMALAVLLLLVRAPADAGVATLPDGWVLAEPGRRVFGAMIDAVAAGVLSALLTGSDLADTVFLGGLLQPGGEWPIALMLIVGMVFGTVSERLWGRSLGKLLTGSSVHRVDGAAGRPTLAGCAARNAVKWFVPPLAAVVVVDPALRHRGDVLAQAAVLVPTDPDEADG